MTTRSIARRYGRALLDVARQEADPEAVERELREITECIEGHDDLRRLLASPAVPTPRKRAAVAALLEHTGSISSVVSKLLLLLAERNRLGLLGGIRHAYGESLLAFRQIVRAEVTTAVPLSAERADAIVRGLSKTTGKHVTLSTHVDPTIIGGVIARLGSVVYDGSVTRQLDRLKATLIDG
jgi:F-type H+-transporting ATPase subunit delta